MRGTLEYEIFFKGDVRRKLLELIGYSDENWAGDRLASVGDGRQMKAVSRGSVVVSTEGKPTGKSREYITLSNVLFMSQLESKFLSYAELSRSAYCTKFLPID